MIAELGATAAVFPPDENTREWLRRQQREDDFAEIGPDDGARVRRPRGDRPGRARPARREAAQPRQRRAGRGGRRARRSSRSASARRSTRPTSTWRCPARCSPTRTAARCTSADGHGHAGLAPDPRGDRRVGRVPPARGGRRADARAGLRALRRHGPGAAVGRELAAHVQPQLPRPLAARPRTPVYLCSPAVAAVSMLHGEIRDPREYGDPPELLEMPELQALRGRPRTSSRRRPRTRPSAIEIPRGPNIKPPPEHAPLERLSARGSPRSSPTTSRPATWRPTA